MRKCFYWLPIVVSVLLLSACDGQGKKSILGTWKLDAIMHGDNNVLPVFGMMQAQVFEDCDIANTRMVFAEGGDVSLFFCIDTVDGTYVYDDKSNGAAVSFSIEEDYGTETFELNMTCKDGELSFPFKELTPDDPEFEDDLRETLEQFEEMNGIEGALPPGVYEAMKMMIEAILSDDTRVVFVKE